MTEIDVLRTVLLLMIATTLALFRVPAKCQYPCVDCEREKAWKDKLQADEQHRYWHGGYDRDECPRCKRDDG